MDFTTEHGAAFVYGTLLRIGCKMGCTKLEVKTILQPQFNDFCDQRGWFSRDAAPDMNPVVWWHNQPDVGLLRRIATCTLSLRSFSANTERLFSGLKLIQSPQQTRFLLGTITKMAQIRVANDWILNGLDEETENSDPAAESKEEEELPYVARNADDPHVIETPDSCDVVTPAS